MVSSEIYLLVRWFKLASLLCVFPLSHSDAGARVSPTAVSHQGRHLNQSQQAVLVVPPNPFGIHLYSPQQSTTLCSICVPLLFFFNRSSRLCISQNALMTCFLFRAYFCISEISSCGCQKHRNSVVTDSMSCRCRHLYFVFMIWTCIHLFICECTAHYPLNGKGLCREYTSTRTGIKNTFPLMEHYSLVLFLLWGQHF